MQPRIVPKLLLDEDISSSMRREYMPRWRRTAAETSISLYNRCRAKTVLMSSWPTRSKSFLNRPMLITQPLHYNIVIMICHPFFHRNKSFIDKFLWNCKQFDAKYQSCFYYLSNKIHKKSKGNFLCEISNKLLTSSRLQFFSNIIFAFFRHINPDKRVNGKRSAKPHLELCLIF